MVFAAAVSLTEQIADHLGREIVTGRLQPGSRIQELRVAGDLRVSRGSVREALLILERRHLVDILPRRGAVVTRLESREISNCAELLTELQQLFYSKLASSRGLDRAPFEEALQAMGLAVQNGSVAEALDARSAFAAGGHAQIENRHLTAVLENLMPAAQRIAHLAVGHPEFDVRDGLRYHQALLGAMVEQDVGRVRELVPAFNARECRLAMCQDAPLSGNGMELLAKAR
jgi:GntR family transcriptional regulator, rspAB operon transcriptional repressor